MNREGKLQATNVSKSIINFLVFTTLAVMMGDTENKT